jgi:hypothetical protein
MSAVLFCRRAGVDVDECGDLCLRIHLLFKVDSKKFKDLI